MENYTDNFSLKLQSWSDDTGHDDTYIAAMSKVSMTTVYRIRIGKVMPNLRTIQKLYKAFPDFANYQVPENMEEAA